MHAAPREVTEHAALWIGIARVRHISKAFQGNFGFWKVCLLVITLSFEGVIAGAEGNIHRDPRALRTTPQSFCSVLLLSTALRGSTTRARRPVFTAERFINTP